MVPGGNSSQFEGKGKKTCTGEGRSAHIEYMQSVKACREKMKESKGVIRGKETKLLQAKGVVLSGTKVLYLERRSQ